MVIVIDIGGTKISAALMDGQTIVERQRAPSPVHDDYKQLPDVLISMVSGWVGRAKGIGIACTGMIQGGDVHFVSIGTKAILPLKQILQTALERPVALINDASAAAWGEYCFGTHTDTDILVYLTISTGIGGGIIQGGKLLTSVGGIASHLGHMTVPRFGEADLQCSCGRWNCIEAIASGTAIAQRGRAIIGEDITTRTVFERCEDDLKLSNLVDDCARSVAYLIADIKAITDTQIVVMGGSVGLSPLFRDRVTTELNRQPQLYHVQITRPKLGVDCDLYGAYLSILDLLDRQDTVFAAVTSDI